MALRYCPMCKHKVSAQAYSCPSCGHPLRESAPVVVHEISPKWNRGIAAVLSFFIPGLGQIYKGQVVGGFVWLVLVGLGYFLFVIPGAILHFFCMLGAAMGDPNKE